MNQWFDGILIASLAVFLAGCIGGPSSGLPEQVTIEPGVFFEINLNMDEGDRIEWIWNASGVLDFDVHTHSDGLVQVHQETSGTSDVGNYTASHGGIHSLLWVNDGDVAVTLEFTLLGNYTVHSMHPAR